jgi:hypothetical protein
MQTTFGRATAFSLLLLAPAACGDGGSAGGSNTPEGVSVVDSAGIRIVTNTGEGTWSDDERWSFEEVFRVGGLDAPVEQQFGAIISVDVGEDGRVYVADQQAKDIAVFEQDGTYVRRIGSPGSGPGEIGPMFMGMFERDGEVWTVDPGGQGIQRFTPEGDYVDAVPFNIMGGVPIRMDEVEAGIVAQRRGIGMDGSIQEGGDAVTTIGAETTDTLLVLAPGESLSLEGGMPQFAFFAPEPLWDVADDGQTVTGLNNRYRFEIRTPEGRTVRIVERDIPGQPVTEVAKRSILQGVREQMETAGAPPQMVQPLLEQATFAETFPAVAQLVLEADGHLWVQRTGNLADLSEVPDFDLQDLGAPRWDVFDPEGVFLGQVELPGRFQPLRMIDGVLWGIDRDDLGVASAVGMRIVR